MTNAEFEKAFDEHKGAVYRFVRRMTSSPTLPEDITQEVFVILLRSPTAFDPKRGSLRPFLLGIARNLVLKWWRDHHPSDQLDCDALSAVSGDLPRGEVSEAVEAAVRSLPPLQREALILAEYEGLTLEEVAQATHSEVGTIKSRLHRARENLRRILAPFKPTYRMR